MSDLVIPEIIKHLPLRSFFIAIVCSSTASQHIEFERITRINYDYPRLELYDSVDDKVEGIIEAKEDDIYHRYLFFDLFLEVVDDIIVDADDDIFIAAGSMTFGRSATRRTDFTFQHKFRSDQ